MGKTIAKMCNGRNIAFERTFENEGQTFGGYYAACQFVSGIGYKFGSMDAGGRGNPIALMKGEYTLPEKWHNFTKEDKQRIDGIMTSTSWRQGEVKIILFDDKIVL